MSNGIVDNKNSVFTVLITFKGETIALQNSMINELYFIEDIFSPCIVGKLKITDKFGLKDNHLLTGSEIISIIYGIESDVKRHFFIYKISNIKSENPGTHQNIDEIEIFFVDATFLIFTQKQISYSWSNMGGDEIIKDILTNICKLPDTRMGKWENSGSQYDVYYSPYWNVLQNINYLLPRMSSGDSDNKRSGFLFYSSTEDLNSAPKFNLVTLQTLLSQTENDILKVNDADDGKYFLFKSAEVDVDKLNKILNWNISGIDKTAFNILQGGKAVRF